jgi:hypothetical protein
MFSRSASSPGGEMMSLREKVKETLWTLSGIGLLTLLLAFYNAPTIISGLRVMYLRHLKAEEAAIYKKIRPGYYQCKEPENPNQQQIESMRSCEDKFFADIEKGVGEAVAIHQRRLRLEVRWGDAESDGAKELGWDHPRAQWDGVKWGCPAGTNPYEIETEMLAGADEYVHCLSEEEAVLFEMRYRDQFSGCQMQMPRLALLIACQSITRLESR